jgi:hypothetical protein
MKKEKVTALTSQFGANGEGRPVRTTLIFSEGLSFALDCYAFESGVPKGEIVRNALGSFLKDKGWDPARIPSAIERWKRMPAARA